MRRMDPLRRLRDPGFTFVGLLVVTGGYVRGICGTFGGCPRIAARNVERSPMSDMRMAG